jgi:hypothetical protein
MVRLPQRPTPQPVRRCLIHQTVEVLPGIWLPDTYGRLSRRQPLPLAEAACPTCLQTARDTLQQQFPALYAPPRA